MAPTSEDLSLLLPEWQGYGLEPSVAHGAREIARLFAPGSFVEIEAPDDESLGVEGGVLGLGSIAPRARRTLELLAARRPDRIFTLGGTCGVELAPVSYLNARYGGDVAVVWLDAHADLNTPASSPSGHFHGMVLRTLLGAGPDSLVGLLPRALSPSQVVLIGARDLDPGEAKYIRQANICTIAPADQHAADVLVRHIGARGLTRVYLHLDLDVLDPAAFPDSLVPTPGGLTLAEVSAVAHELTHQFEIVGFSLVEFRPSAPGAIDRISELLRSLQISIGVVQAMRSIDGTRRG